MCRIFYPNNTLGLESSKSVTNRILLHREGETHRRSR